ncbi:condensation protein, partial [Streptomyces griseus]|nr:condensation protein [Streptomyces griseus]
MATTQHPPARGGTPPPGAPGPVPFPVVAELAPHCPPAAAPHTAPIAHHLPGRAAEGRPRSPVAPAP